MPDIVLLDWMIESLPGIEVCRRLRRNPKSANVPIIMLTARGEEEDRIRGLETGADDYVTKPFSPRELVARVQAVLRRLRPALAGEMLTYADIELDSVAHKVVRSSQIVAMGPTEFRLLRHFMEHPAASSPAVIARQRLGTGQRHRTAHRRRPYPPPAQGDQLPGTTDIIRTVARRLCAGFGQKRLRFQAFSASSPFASSEVEIPIGSIPGCLDFARHERLLTAANGQRKRFPGGSVGYRAAPALQRSSPLAPGNMLRDTTKSRLIDYGHPGLIRACLFEGKDGSRSIPG